MYLFFKKKYVYKSKYIGIIKYIVRKESIILLVYYYNIN